MARKSGKIHSVIQQLQSLQGIVAAAVMQRKAFHASAQTAQTVKTFFGNRPIKVVKKDEQLALEAAKRQIAEKRKANKKVVGGDSKKVAQPQKPMHSVTVKSVLSAGIPAQNYQTGSNKFRTYKRSAYFGEHSSRNRGIIDNARQRRRPKGGAKLRDFRYIDPSDELYEFMVELENSHSEHLF